MYGRVVVLFGVVVVVCVVCWGLVMVFVRVLAGSWARLQLGCGVV